jgi:hypothetical protein
MCNRSGVLSGKSLGMRILRHVLPITTLQNVRRLNDDTHKYAFSPGTRCVFHLVNNVVQAFLSLHILSAGLPVHNPMLFHRMYK